MRTHFNQSPDLPNSPCIECKDRCLGCHGVCRSYKEYAEKMRALNKKRRNESVSANMTRPEARVDGRELKRQRKKMLGKY